MEHFGIVNFWMFLAAGIILNLTPGPDTFYILGRSLGQGTRAGIYSALGISTGSIVHTLMAAFGLSTVLATSSAAFNIVKIIGAFYLIYLGLSLLIQKSQCKQEDKEVLSKEGKYFPEEGKEPSWLIYRQGVMTNVLNPKVALFFLSFLPQFVDAGSPSQFVPFLLLGLTFIVTGTMWCLFIAWCAGSLIAYWDRPSGNVRWLNKLPGFLFIGLGANLLISQK